MLFHSTKVSLVPVVRLLIRIDYITNHSCRVNKNHKIDNTMVTMTNRRATTNATDNRLIVSQNKIQSISPAGSIIYKLSIAIPDNPVEKRSGNIIR